VATNLTPKQEAFVQAYLTTGNASEAYRVAYDAEKMKPSVINVKASELLADGKISVRVSTLRERAVERTLVTVEAITDRLLALAEKAEAKDSESGLNVSRASLMDVAKLNGLVIEKTAHSGGIELTSITRRVVDG